jgi:Uma2 family endonuclease
MPWPGRFTAGDLENLPDWGLRGEVIDGRLLLAPRPSRRHERVVHNLARWLGTVLPASAGVTTARPVRLPDDDGPVPDLVVTSRAVLATGAGPVPASEVHTVVEVVEADGRFVDRVLKRERYAGAGVPCYWRVELAPWSGYRGPTPLVVVRSRARGGWRELVAPAGQVSTVPLAHGRGEDGMGCFTSGQLDPRALLVGRARV